MSQEGPGKHFTLFELLRHNFGRFESRTIVRSSNETIVGIAERGALPSDPVWLLEQTIVTGSGQTLTRSADDAQFSQTWDSAVDGTAFPIVAGVNTLAVNFGGANQFMNGGNICNFDIATAFTINMWVKPQNIAGNRILFSKAGPAAAVDGYMLRHNAGTGALFLQMRTTTIDRSFTFSSALTAGVYQMMTFTYDGSSNINGARTYIDSVVGSTPGSGALGGTMLLGQDFLIGQRTSTFYFSGVMDEISVWDKALDAAEVTELYNGGVPLDPTSHSAVANNLHWWRCGDNDTFPVIADNQGSSDLTMTNMVAGDIVTDPA